MAQFVLIQAQCRGLCAPSSCLLRGLRAGVRAQPSACGMPFRLLPCKSTRGDRHDTQTRPSACWPRLTAARRHERALAVPWACPVDDVWCCGRDFWPPRACVMYRAGATRWKSPPLHQQNVPGSRDVGQAAGSVLWAGSWLCPSLSSPRGPVPACDWNS